MIEEMEKIENSLGSDATMHWAKDYLRYLANPHASKLDVVFGIAGAEANETAYLENGTSPICYYQFKNRKTSIQFNYSELFY